MSRRYNISFLILFFGLTSLVSPGFVFAQNQQENQEEDDQSDDDYVENFMQDENSNNNANEINQENSNENLDNVNFDNLNSADFNGGNVPFNAPTGNINPAAEELPVNNIQTEVIPPSPENTAVPVNNAVPINNMTPVNNVAPVNNSVPLNNTMLNQPMNDSMNGNPLPENIPTEIINPVNQTAPTELNPATPLNAGDPTQVVDPTTLPVEAAPVNPVPEMLAPAPDAPVIDTAIVAPGAPVDMAPPVQGSMQPNEFSGAPPLFGTKRMMAMGEAPEEYVVEAGDTLFDVCDQLIDEPNYWPKLWAMNPEIKNPHFIFPGMKLRFYPGDRETPPFLQVVMEDDVVPIDQGSIGAKELVEDAPRPRQDISALLTNFGGPEAVTLIGPDELMGGDGVATAITVIGEPPRPGQVIVDVPAFIYEEEKNPLGKVVGGVSGLTLMDKNEEVIVQDESGVATGTTYTVLRPSETIYDSVSGLYIGKRYEFVAHLRITQKSDEGLLLGKVTENRLGVQPGDELFAYRSTRRVVSTTGVSPPNGGNGNAIIGFDNPEMLMGGAGSLVIFEALSSRAFSVGQTVAVFQDINKSASAFIADKLPNTARDVAIVRIIDATDVGAVGYVLSNKREIRLGDRAGKG